jgi:hypothetical protein
LVFFWKHILVQDLSDLCVLVAPHKLKLIDGVCTYQYCAKQWNNGTEDALRFVVSIN